MTQGRSAGLGALAATVLAAAGVAGQSTAESRDPGPAVDDLSPKCAGMRKGARCWQELADKPGCHVFRFYYDPSEPVTWSGACAGAVAVGQGTLEWSKARATGTLVRGRLRGNWLFRFADGTVAEGPVAAGKQHGKWVTRRANGIVEEGPFANGKRHGRWVERFANGAVLEGPYVRGKRHGKWIMRAADGRCGAVTFDRGKRRPPISRC